MSGFVETCLPKQRREVLRRERVFRVDDVEPAFVAFDLCEKIVQIIEIRGVGFDRRDVAPHKLRG